MSVQQKVLDFIKHDRTLTGARNLYNSLPNKSLSFLASINRMRASEANIKHVCYQLCKAVGLQERQMQALWNNPVTAKEEAQETEAKMIVVGSGDSVGKTAVSQLFSIKPEELEWKDIQSFAATLSEETGNAAEGRSKKDLLAFIEKERSNLVTKTAEGIPPAVKQSIKLREQFPFLKEKACPDILKVLVNDLISSYDNYKKGHAKLFDAMTREEEAAIAEGVVLEFISNKEAFAELEQYGNTGELLGKHPAFRVGEIKEELATLNGADLNKKYNALRKNISTNQKRADEATEADQKSKYNEVVEDYTWQLEFVKELLEKLKK